MGPHREQRLPVRAAMIPRGIFNGIARRNSGKLLVVAYDWVGASEPAHSQAESHDPRAVDLGEFKWQMEQIAGRFEPIVLSRLMGHLGGKKPLAGPQICVSLLLGTEGAHHGAIDVLTRLNISATCFVPFESIRENRVGDLPTVSAGIDWSTVRDLVAAGADVGHRVTTESGLCALGSPQRRAQLSALRIRVEQETGAQVHAIAFAGQGRERDISLIYDAAIAGFNLGVEANPGYNALHSLNPMMLKSRAASRDLGREQFRGLLDALGRAE